MTPRRPLHRALIFAARLVADVCLAVAVLVLLVITGVYVTWKWLQRWTIYGGDKDAQEKDRWRRK